MNPLTTCPGSEVLRRLLDGTLPGSQEDEVNAHLESCSHCQQTLESLAAGKESWSGTVKNLREGKPPVAPCLRRVLEESQRARGDERAEPEANPTDDFSLDFLDPPENPAHLGRLGHYEVVEIIGRGGMGIVLKAFDAVLHRIVAVKVLAPQLATTATARKRFEREARAAAAISHEHVVAIYEVGATKGLPYLVMEYVAGVSLQERLDRNGPQELKEILRIGVQIAGGLAAAHGQGLIHRDIKPANVLLHNGVERVKITDFGLARAIDDASLTQSGCIAGTPQYMAPEQARGDAVDHRADLFSLGSVLYAMCTGRPPFRASTTLAVLKRVSEEKPRALAEINPELPRWLIEVIEKLHAQEPAARFQSAAGVAEQLSQYLAQLQHVPPRPKPITLDKPLKALTPQPGRPARYRRWAVAAALLLLIGGGLTLTDAAGLTHVAEFLGTVLRIRIPEGEPANPKGDLYSLTPAQLQTIKNLQEIGRAMERFREAHHHYPSPVVYGENRKPLWSWRVLILPFLGEEKLYKEFKLEEPWDSPNNSKLLAKRPMVFAPPTGAFQKDDWTFYRALVGMVVEGGEPVRWTEPEELVYEQGKELPKLGGLFADRFYVLFRDSSVHAIGKDGFDEDKMRALLLRNQGQIVDLDELKPLEKGHGEKAKD